MRKLLAAVALTVASSAAHADTMANFEAEYARNVKWAIAHGYVPTRTCFPNYCATSMVTPIEGGGWAYIANITSNDGLNTREVCNGSNYARRCWTSDGRIIDEVNNGKGWVTSGTIANNFTE